jgi:hypothetical protein
MRRTPGENSVFSMSNPTSTGKTLGTQIVGAGEAHRTEDRQNGFAADFLVVGVMATGARQLTLLGRRSFEWQQFA